MRINTTTFPLDPVLLEEIIEDRDDISFDDIDGVDSADDIENSLEVKAFIDLSTMTVHQVMIYTRGPPGASTGQERLLKYSTNQ